ncbi:hypothetical protein [Flavobacterium beibuense]|uniref:hypothetical protein n=1 Tax=Flavobacterium beibuense TaxID=657326 RepID=UPI003A956539
MENTLENYIEVAELAYREGRWEEVDKTIRAAQEIVSDSEGNIDDLLKIRFYRLGIIYWTMYDNDLDIEFIKKYSELLEGLNTIALTDYQMICSFYNECPEEIMQRALLQYPDDLSLLNAYAKKLQELGQHNNAIIILEHLTELYPEASFAQLMLMHSRDQLLKVVMEQSENVSTDEDIASSCFDLAIQSCNMTAINELKEYPIINQQEKKLIHLDIQKCIYKKGFDKVSKKWKEKWIDKELDFTSVLLLANYFYEYNTYGLVKEVLEGYSFAELEQINEINEFNDLAVYWELANINKVQNRIMYNFFLANAYHYTGEAEKAAQCVNAGLELDPNNALLTVLKSNTQLTVDKDPEEAYNTLSTAHLQGLPPKTYYQQLIMFYRLVADWNNVIRTINQYEVRNVPNEATIFYKADAFAHLGYQINALECLEDGIQYFSHTPYIISMYQLRMMIYKNQKKYKLFFDDVKHKLSYCSKKGNEYWSTINQCVEIIFIIGDYRRCYEYASEAYRNNRLHPQLLPILQWLIAFDHDDYQEIPEVPEVTNDSVINNPQTPMDYFGNALRFWIMGFNLASAQAFEQAGDMGWETMYCYKRAFWRACRSEGHEEYTLELYDKIMAYDPTQREWLIDYRYAYILYTLKRYEQAIKGYKMLMEYYPNTAFEEEKDYNHNAAVLLDCERNIGNIEAATRYTSMRMSWQVPQKSDCKRLQVMADEHYPEELFLRYNLLRLSEEIETGLSQNEKESLKDIKRKLKSEYFS